ncbi:hypothetical protein yc1106_07008 [Curvularia clavata]|uniref:Uncharacterized protein n=1 Tax=Curvularia clavata TaxID=95742 RepID=A0A9Q9DVD0_CURCL|nr:hypothetical protein yc1106_07008 [Curvularia clavata]
MDSDSGRNSQAAICPSIHPNAMLSRVFWQKNLGRGGDVQLTALDHVAPWAIRRVSDHWEAAVPAYSSCQLPAAIHPLASWLTFLPEPGAPTWTRCVWRWIDLLHLLSPAGPDAVQ